MELPGWASTFPSAQWASLAHLPGGGRFSGRQHARTHVCTHTHTHTHAALSPQSPASLSRCTSHVPFLLSRFPFSLVSFPHGFVPVSPTPPQARSLRVHRTPFHGREGHSPASGEALARWPHFLGRPEGWAGRGGAKVPEGGWQVGPGACGGRARWLRLRGGCRRAVVAGEAPCPGGAQPCDSRGPGREHGSGAHGPWQV